MNGQIELNILTDRWADGKTHRQTNRQTERQAEDQTLAISFSFSFNSDFVLFDHSVSERD